MSLIELEDVRLLAENTVYDIGSYTSLAELLFLKEELSGDLLCNIITTVVVDHPIDNSLVRILKDIFPCANLKIRNN